MSYTHIDDEAFGGAITGLRRSLELHVRVATGNRDFHIFQDIDGIQLGESWDVKLESALGSSRFLIPILTPLFFGSEACRGELRKFAEHERTYNRNDLILPIYFVTTPALEPGGGQKPDDLATLISSRQRVDWRKHADSPLTDPLIRKEVRALADKIAIAIARTELPVQSQYSVGRTGEVPFTHLVRIDEETRLRKQQPPTKEILWVDDRPNNNVRERIAFEAYNVKFTLSVSTGEALASLRMRRFDAIISDMGRPPDPRAGYNLLEAVRGSGDNTPFFIYAGSGDPEHTAEAKRRGAQGSTNIADVLIKEVLSTIDAFRSEASGRELRREW